MKPPPRVSEEEEERPDVSEKEEELPGVEEEERCGGPPTSPSSHLKNPPLCVREEERCDGG
jgi:hypothetical protein